MYQRSCLNLSPHYIEPYPVPFPIFVDCGECVDRLVSIVTSIEALLREVVSSVNTLVALHQLDVDGLSSISMRVNRILVRQLMPLHYCCVLQQS